MPTTMPKEMQTREAADRNATDTSTNPREDAELNAGALEIAADDDAGSGLPEIRQETTDAPVGDIQPTIVPKSPKDEIRDAIAKNFRSNRAVEREEAADEDRQLREMAGLPEELRDQFVEEEPEIARVPQRQQPDPNLRQPERPQELEQQPQRFKLKINGEERFVTIEEMTAAAQKALASDDVLGSAKKAAQDILDEARALKNEIEGQRTAFQPAGNQGGDGEGVQPEAGNQGGDQVDPYEALVEQLQYGDPKEAAANARKLIEDRARAVSRAELIQGNRVAEHQRSMAALNKFRQENPDLAADEDANAVMRVRLFREQHNDLVQSGLDPKRLPEFKPENFEAIANLHLDARTFGVGVRDIPTLLKATKDGYLSKFGGQREQPEGQGEQRQQQQQPSGKAVTVEVNRTERRQAIAQQPTRTMAPRLQPQEKQRDQLESRTNAVERMRAARSGPRNPGVRASA
jgi:hypothetical protein